MCNKRLKCGKELIFKITPQEQGYILSFEDSDDYPTSIDITNDIIDIEEFYKITKLVAARLGYRGKDNDRLTLKDL